MIRNFPGIFRIRKAFTLIELLIVVAIIAILAAIAVPNFLEAQTRSKVSRTLADMRTIRTGLESYQVDNNHYPETDRGIQELITNNLRSIYRLTTPISYLTSIPQSPWKENYGKGNPSNPKIASEIGSFLYVRKELDSSGNPASGELPEVNADYANDRLAYVIMGRLMSQAARNAIISKGEWELKSAGPDADDDFNVSGVNARVYDPTNGTVSSGDIVIFSDMSGIAEPQ